MKAPRSTAPPAQVPPAPPCGGTITRRKKMLKMEIAPNKSLEIKGKIKKMLRMKESPNNLLKTQGRKGTSQ